MKSSRSFLTTRQRFCIYVAALAALNRRTEAYRFLRRAISASPFPTVFLQEVFIHLSLVLGFPAMLDGLEFVKRIRPEGGASGAKRKSRPPGEGRRIIGRIYGRQTAKLLQNISQIHPDVRSMILNDVYGNVFARPGLTLKERELINVTVLALQGLDRQLYSHLRGSVRVGVKADAINEGLRHVQRITGRSMRTARTLLRVVVSQRKKW